MVVINNDDVAAVLLHNDTKTSQLTNNNAGIHIPQQKTYCLGIDGGNTKTDYFLFCTDGKFIDCINDGTCSHEALADRYEGAYNIMNSNITKLLYRNFISADMIEAAVFGLAGADMPFQYDELNNVVKRFGFKKSVVINDSFLGIKAAAKSGYGVCSINGTGTCAGGIDSFGNIVQIGGIGEISGDEAGGHYIFRMALRAVYDSLFRCSEPTRLTDKVMYLLGVPNKAGYSKAIHYENLRAVSKNTKTEIIKLVVSLADAGDAASMSIIKNVGIQLAKSAAGCIGQLKFIDEAEIVMAGSVWVKSGSRLMQDVFIEHVTNHVSSYNKDLKLSFTMLNEPPATGAVIWALELAGSTASKEDIKRQVRLI